MDSFGVLSVMVDVPTIAVVVTFVGLAAITAVLLYLAFVVAARQDLATPPDGPDADEPETADSG